MTSYPKIVTIQPALVPEDRFARNGLSPTPTAMARIAHVLNNVSTYQKRPLGQSGTPLENVGQSLNGTVGSPTTAYSVCVHTGENADKIIVYVLGESGGSTGYAPTVYLELDDGAVQTTSNNLQLPAKGMLWNELDDVPVQLPLSLEIDCDPDTEYVLHIKGYDRAIVRGMMAYEQATVSPDADAIEGLVTTAPWEQGKPVYYQDIQKLLEAATKLWQHNGAMAFHLIKPPISDLVINGVTTYTNLITSGGGTAPTAFSANALGFHIRSTYHGSRVSGVIPYKIMCFGGRVSGTGTLDIKLVKSGSTVHEWTGITDTWSPFQSDTFTHASLDEKVDVLMRVSDGSTRFDLNSLALIEYEV